MKIYVINLDSSIDRWNKISKNLGDAGTDYERIPAIHGKSIDWQSQSDDVFCRSYMGRSIQPGEVGCFLSHLAALKNFISQDDAFSIILEDDAEISADFLEKIDLIIKHLSETEFYAVNLGPSDYKYSTLFSRIGESKLYCTHRFPMLATGVLWSKAGAQKFVNDFKKVSLPYDNYLRVFLTGTNKGFSIKPCVIKSIEMDSDIDAASLTTKRSSLNRSKAYFLIKQKRMLFEKCKALLSMIKFRFFER